MMPILSFHKYIYAYTHIYTRISERFMRVLYSFLSFHPYIHIYTYT